MAFVVAVAILPSVGTGAFAQSASPSPTASASPSPSPSEPPPPIQLLNPSKGTTLILSDKSTSENNTFRLSAWAMHPVSSQASVEFEIDTIPTTTIPATRKPGGDTFEAEWAIPNTILDGPYELSAILFEPNNIGDAEEVGRDTETITMRQGQPSSATQANTVDLLQPDATGVTPFYAVDGGRYSTVLSAAPSSGSTFVQFKYTISAPGEEPTWTACGNPRPSGGVASTRCTLAEGVLATQVTAIAAIANSTPSGQAFSSSFNEGADAQRITPYIQVPTSISALPDTQTVDEDDGEFPCNELIVLTVKDQVGLPIPGANIDVHATGPTDNLRFGLGLFDSTSGSQSPDEGHNNEELGYDCEGLSPSSELIGFQGEHNIGGAPDIKHLESNSSGTSNSGTWEFYMHTDAPGTTDIVAWVDQNDNDLQDVGEIGAGAQIGWGGPPTAPKPKVEISPRTAEGALGDCERFVAVVRQNGQPVAGQNIDVHATGPDASVEFCDPADSSAHRDPDQGAHQPDGSHADDGTKHTEGETAADGTFIFGVTSSSQGDTLIMTWADFTDDDVATDGESFAKAAVTWAPTGHRSISLDRNKRKVKKGRKVKFFGEISGESVCTGDQKVKLKARRRGTRKRFRTVTTVFTDDQGEYQARVKIKKSKDYRAVAPKSDPCDKAKSPTRTVKAK